MEIQCWRLKRRAVPLRALKVGPMSSTPHLDFQDVSQKLCTAGHLQGPGSYDQVISSATSHL